MYDYIYKKRQKQNQRKDEKKQLENKNMKKNICMDTTNWGDWTRKELQIDKKCKTQKKKWIFFFHISTK